jgi:hypothetical protein
MNTSTHSHSPHPLHHTVVRTHTPAPALSELWIAFHTFAKHAVRIQTHKRTKLDARACTHLHTRPRNGDVEMLQDGRHAMALRTPFTFILRASRFRLRGLVSSRRATTHSMVLQYGRAALRCIAVEASTSARTESTTCRKAIPKRAGNAMVCAQAKSSWIHLPASHGSGVLTKWSRRLRRPLQWPRQKPTRLRHRQ